MVQSDEYVLGAQDDEIRRLGLQHQTWLAQAYALFDRGGLRTGERVLDLGSGPGFTSFELSELVGPTGAVLACDRSEHFLAHLAREADRRGHDQLSTHLGDLAQLDVPAGSYDAAYARWLLCWVPDPGAILQRVARALRPGGRVLIQDYVDWGGTKLLPRHPAYDAAVKACLASFDAGGGTIDIGEHMPALAAEAGLELEYLAPFTRVGRVGSLEWRWMSEFFRGYLPKLEAAGGISGDAHAALVRELDEEEASGNGWFYAPTVVDVILRKPR